MTQNAQQLQGSELRGRRVLLEDGHCEISYQGESRLEAAETPEKLTAKAAESQRKIFNITWESPRDRVCRDSVVREDTWRCLNPAAWGGKGWSLFSIQKQSLTRGSRGLRPPALLV